MTKLVKVSGYDIFLDEIKTTIVDTRIRAAKAVSSELIHLYWSIGRSIAEKQENEGWGKTVVEKLAQDLQQVFQGRSGFSARNLWKMRQFYLEYQSYEKLPQLVAEIPWGHHIELMAKVKEPQEREYYLKSTVEMGWSRNVLLHQIKSDAYQRHQLANKQHNFDKALPAHLAEQADEAMKDVYMLDMLGIAKPVLERELEQKMVAKIQDVMLELGYGFAFIGNQYRIIANEKEYFVDLLFSNRRLNSLVAVELKIGRFKPEYAGKMNFYLNLLDDFVREPGENPSIGIILCTERDYFEVEYALRGLEKPVGVADYLLTQELPEALRSKLPDAKLLEQELRKELGEEEYN